MKEIYLVPLFILPTLHAAKKSTPALEQPKVVQKAKVPKKPRFNAFQDDSFIFADRQTNAFESQSTDSRPVPFPEDYNQWNENTSLNKAAFDY